MSPAELVGVLASISFLFFPGFQIAAAQFKRDHSYVHLVFLAMLPMNGERSVTLSKDSSHPIAPTTTAS